MTRKIWQFGLLSMVGLLTAALPARADTEQREFNVQVDGKNAGQSTVQITAQLDGSFVVKAQVDVKFKQFLANYAYSYSGTEVWRDGKLVQLNSSTNDNGKKLEVTARTDPKGLRVVVNSKEHIAKGDAWTTSYWKLADAKYHNQAVSILDVDTGKDINGRLQYVGAEQMQVAGQKANCYHFRVTGGPSAVELWYDAQQRLVRMEFNEEGHRTVVQLTGIKK